MTKDKKENQLQKLEINLEQEKPVKTEAQLIVIMDNNLPYNSLEKATKEEKHPAVVFGSNNIIGHNIFLVNTNSEQESLESLIKALPSEFLEKLMLAMGSVIEQEAQKTNNQNSGKNGKSRNSESARED